MKLKHWCYLVLLLVPAIVRLIQKISTDSGGFASRYLPLIVTLVLIIGFVGYMQQWAFLKRWIWRVLFWLVSLVYTAAIIFAGSLLFNSAISVWHQLLLMGIAVIFIPALVSLFKYSQKDANIWNK
ncbi:hypothetical protein [Glaciecola sp. 1036]|uniref:hypothetical protein n=1 Tax=Alteromonadaceae TaxID=72275 RepID=UPI003D006078